MCCDFDLPISLGLSLVISHEVWVLWVPNVHEEKREIRYADDSVTHQNSFKEKALTERKIQEFRERKETLLQDEDNFFETPLLIGAGKHHGQWQAQGQPRQQE